MSCRIFAALLVALSCANLAGAQNDSEYKLKRGDNEYGVWGGGAFTATTIFGGLTDAEADERGFVIAAFRYGRTLAANDHLALQYTLDAIPMALAVGNIESATTLPTPAGPVTTFTRDTAYGAGVTPLGLQLDFANSSRVKPFIHVNGGLLVFNESVPLPDAGKLALVGEAGAGVRVFTSERRAVSLGVRFHHISNGDRAGANRGLNQFVFYAGFSVFK
ncbi:MAG TPA: acyloxyacyl hydrolase [Pyrinomonadaceae bacterium]|nr:acyloxyacyl hydrolase [Pyrinomonadaceae bacterium]